MAGFLPSHRGGDRKVSALLLAGLLITLSACGSSDNDPGPGGVSVGEARALDDAAEMLDAQRLPREALETPAATDAPVAGESASAAGTAPLGR